MRIDVTFEQTDMEIRPAFDTIIPLDISSASVQALLDGTISGKFASDKVTKLKYAAFFGCDRLTKIELPNCIEIGYRAFYNCAKVEKLHMPNLTTIATDANSAFAYMSSVKELDLPNLTTASNMDGTFSNCTKAKKINLSSLDATPIKRYCFANCYALHTLILGGAFKALENTNAFSWAGSQAEKPFCIYVPDNLVDTYRTATNWITYADKIKPMSALEG